MHTCCCVCCFRGSLKLLRQSKGNSTLLFCGWSGQRVKCGGMHDRKGRKIDSEWVPHSMRLRGNWWCLESSSSNSRDWWLYVEMQVYGETQYWASLPFCLKINFIEISFTYNVMNPFKMHNSVCTRVELLPQSRWRIFLSFSKISSCFFFVPPFFYFSPNQNRAAFLSQLF